MAKPYKDYKYCYVKRNNDGFITEAKIRFFKGEYSGEAYIRLAKYISSELSSLKGSLSGNDVIYTPTDFGQIETNAELNTFLKQELAMLTGRTAISIQLV